MTIETQTPRVVIIGNGTRGPYSLVDSSGQAIRFVSTSHLRLTRYSASTDDNNDGSLLVENTDYTVGGTQDARTFTLADGEDVLTSSQRILAERVQGYTQDLDLTTGGAFNAAAVEARLNKHTEYLQEMKAQLARKVSIQYVDSTADVALPSPPTSATQVLGHNTSGEVVHVTPASLGTDVALGTGWEALLGLPTTGILDNISGVRFVSNNAALTALTTATGLVDNGVYQTQGRSTERDGGEGLWIYDSASSTAANTGTILAIDGGGVGRFFRVLERPGVVWVKWFGDTSTASGFTAAWQAATTAAGAGGEVHIPYGSYSINGAITILGAQRHIGHGLPFITKTANVAELIVMTQAARARLQGLVILGAGGTYTGKGVYIGAHADSYEQEIRDCIIQDFSSACVHFDGEDAGTRSIFENSSFRRTTVTDPAILGSTVAESNGNRMISNCDSTGGNLIQINSMVNTGIDNCSCVNIDFSGSNTVQTRTRVTGCRIATLGADLEVYGNDNSIVGNIIAGGLILKSAASRNHISGNTLASGEAPEDESTATGDNVNWIDAGEYTVTATLTGSGSNPTTSAKTCRVTRAGKRVTIDFAATLNAVGTGTYQIALPSPFTTWVAKHAARGAGLFTDASTGNTYNLVAVVATGGATITLYTGNALVTDAAPVAAAAGDIITFTIEYELS